MSASTSEILSQYIQTIGDPSLVRMIQNTKVASATFALLEICATLPDEIAFLWPAKWSTMKVVYMVNKYSPILDTTMGIVLDMGTRSAEACKQRYQILGYAYVVGAMFSEFILVARTIALWEFNRYVMALLVGAGSLMLPFALYTINQVASSAKQYPEAIVRVLGCVPCIDDQDTWPAFAFLMMAETGIIGLTSMKRKTVPTDGVSKSAVFRTIYRDGSLFFAIVLAMSILNLLVMMLAPQGLSSFAIMPLRVVHSALCTRVLLNLRIAAAGSSATTLDDFTKQETTIVFDYTGSVGNEAELEDLGYYES